jgi:predicted Zn-ribbon and HTH transcriptional regulator
MRSVDRLSDRIRKRNDTAEDERLCDAAPDLLDALRKIDANAAESAEWIRRIARAAIRKAEGGVSMQCMDCGWSGRHESGPIMGALCPKCRSGGRIVKA